jgi:hypothetical protein
MSKWFYALPPALPQGQLTVVLCWKRLKSLGVKLLMNMVNTKLYVVRAVGV